MRRQLLFVLVVLVVSATGGVAAADSFEPSAGTVTVQDDPGQRDTVTFYVPSDVDDPEQFSRAVVREAGLPVRELRTDEEETTDSYTPVVVTTTVGERTGLLSRTVDAETLTALAAFEDTRLVVELADVATVTGVGEPIERDGSDRLYAVSGDRDVSYHLPVWRVGLLAAVVLGAALVPFAGFRWYGRRVVRGDGDDEGKVHRLRLATTVGMFPLVIALTPLLFETDVFPITMFLVSGILPGLTSNEIVELLVIMGSVMTPLSLSFVAVVLAVFPYDKQLRDTTIDARTTAKKSLAGLALIFVPLVGWFLVITQLPADLLSNEFVMIALLAVFLGAIMALQPYLIVLLQDTRELQGPLRERLDAFCAAQDRSLRNVYRIDGQGNKLANALVAGTIPGFNYVFITDHLIAEFPDEEVEAIVAHELGHLEHRHLWYQGGLTLLVFGGWILGADSLGLDVLIDRFGFYGSFLPIMGLMLVYLVVLRGWLAVRQEYEADAYAAAKTGTETTARALRRLGEANYQREDTGWLYNRLTFHPSIADRVEHVRESSGTNGEPTEIEPDE